MSTRYYSPNLGRFLNADAFTTTGQGLLGNNMFAYCLNNPVNTHDPNGTCSYSVYMGGKVGDGECYRCKNAHSPQATEYVTDAVATYATYIITVTGNPLAAAIANNTINVIYYQFSSKRSYLEWNSQKSSYTEGYITRWDRLNYTKQETGDRSYFPNAWRYNSEYSMHLYGWYALSPFEDRGFERIDSYIESLERAHILPYDHDENWKSRVLTYLFGLLGV